MRNTNNLKALRQRAADLRADIRTASTTATTIGTAIIRESRSMTPEERTSFAEATTRRTELETEFESVSNDLRVAERENERERAGGTGGEPVIDPDAAAASAAASRAGLHGGDRFDGGLARAARGRTFADLFGPKAVGNDGWSSQGEFLHAVSNSLNDRRIRMDVNQSGEIPSLGGIAIPLQYVAEWFSLAVQQSFVLQGATLFGMTSSELQVPALDDQDQSSGSIAGLALQFLGEAQSGTFQALKLRALRLRARKAGLFVNAPNELVSDATNWDQNLSNALVKVLASGTDVHALFGDGSTGCLGCLVAPATLVIPRTTPGLIGYPDILNMFSRMLPDSIGNAVWIANPTCIPQLATMTVPIGTGGALIPVLTSTAGKFQILTRDVIWTSRVPALGTKSDLSFVDLKYIAYGLRSQMAIERSAHVGFVQDTLAYRLLVRFDAQPMLAQPMVPLNGSSLSPFITLNT
jgi:HK97 family phage major capsid protein